MSSAVPITAKDSYVLSFTFCIIGQEQSSIQPTTTSDKKMEMDDCIASLQQKDNKREYTELHIPAVINNTCH